MNLEKALAASCLVFISKLNHELPLHTTVIFRGAGKDPVLQPLSPVRSRACG